MPFRLFHDLFPDVAERETRTITVLPGSGLGLPAADYAFLEMFCDEPRCDCHRVLWYVVSSSRKNLEAVVAWGWEDVEFYAKWMKYGDRKDAEALRGPILNPGSLETELAPALLELARNVLLQDSPYIERIKRHYRMFRTRIDERGGRVPGKGRRKARP